MSQRGERVGNTDGTNPVDGRLVLRGSLPLAEEQARAGAIEEVEVEDRHLENALSAWRSTFLTSNRTYVWN